MLSYLFKSFRCKLASFLGMRVAPHLPSRSREFRGGQISIEEINDLLDRPRRAGEVLDLRGYDLRNLNLSGSRFERVIFGGGDGPSAQLGGANFSRSTFSACSFAQVDLDDVDLSRCRFDDCDLEGAAVTERTSMKGTRFLLSQLPESIGLARGLHWDGFSPGRDDPALVMEDESSYRSFLRPDSEMVGGSEVTDLGALLDGRLDEAARFYRELSISWTKNGRFRDADSAYAHARRLEREAMGPRFRGRPFRPVPWLGLWLSDLLCGFGENASRFVPWAVALALLPGVVYWLAGGVDGGHGLADDLLFSASSLAAATPARLTSTNPLINWISVIQILTGVALLGVWGFTLGQKIRHG